MSNGEWNQKEHGAHEAMHGKQKREQWDAQMKLLSAVGDDDLPIDNRDLQTLLAAFNLLGVRTIASNGGHAEQTRNTGDTVYPWILIEPEEIHPGESDVTEEARDASARNVHAVVDGWLREFYATRSVDPGIRLKTTEVAYGQFLISTVSPDVDERIASGTASDAERQALREKLPAWQTEVKEFGVFLEKKFFEMPTVRYMVVYYDTNGVGRLMGGDNFFKTKSEAEMRIKEVQDRLTKEHKVDYRIVPYAPGTREQVMQEKGIVG